MEFYFPLQTEEEKQKYPQKIGEGDLDQIGSWAGYNNASHGGRHRRRRCG
jgi:hypothetical protein